MKPAKILTRLTACALALGQLLTTAAGASFYSGFTYSYPVGEGLTYTRTEGRNSSGLQKANILTYTPNTGVSPMMVYVGDKLYGSKATISNAARYLAGKGKNVIGGTNADFFVMTSGIPIGLVIDEGELISSDAWQYAVGFKADGSAVIGRPTMGIRVSGASGTVNVSYFNKTRTTVGAYLLDKNYDSSTHFALNGTNIILERIDDAPVKVNGSVRLRVINKGTGSSPITITDNQMVLTKSDGADVPSWADFQIGEEVTLSIASNDPNWSEVQYAAGGKLLISNGSVTANGIDAGSVPRARSAAGVRADGSVVIYEVDGNQASHSAGLTAQELGNELLEMGCVNAVCLDGGGSSAMLMRQPGESSASLISSPSDGSERACANYIFFVNNAAPDGVTAHAVLAPEYRYLMPGASTLITLKGADASYGPAPVPEGMVYTVEGDKGKVEGSAFTAPNQTGTATVKGSNGAVEGSMTVCVTDAVDSLALSSGGNAVDSVTVQPGKSVDIDVTAYHHGKRMASYDPAASWTVSGDIGTVDENGVFTASDKAGQGTVTCSFGSASKTVQVNVVGISDAQKAVTVADFEAGQAATATEGISLTTVTGYSEAARGKGSLKAGYNASQTGSGTITFPAADVSGMGYVTIWAKGAGRQNNLMAAFAGEDGSEINSPFDSPTAEEWGQLAAVVPSGAKAFTGIRFVGNGMASGDAALYLDQIVMSEKHAVTNPDAPAITLSNTSMHVDPGAAAVITGVATMESGQYPVREGNISVKVDGKPVQGAVKMNGQNLTATINALAQGTHCVTIDVSDDAGNRSRASATVTSGGVASAFADTGSHWANGYASLLSATGVMQGESSNGSLYFRPNRNLRRMEFAVTMARALGLDTSYTGSMDFTDDASIPSWARGAIYAVSQAGIMNGRKDGSGVSFAPDADMTRAEVMTVIGRSLPKGYAEAPLGYTDAYSVPAWAVEQVRICVSAGIIGGYQDNTLRPLGSITRGEIAKILALY